MLALSLVMVIFGGILRNMYLVTTFSVILPRFPMRTGVIIVSIFCVLLLCVLYGNVYLVLYGVLRTFLAFVALLLLLCFLLRTGCTGPNFSVFRSSSIQKRRKFDSKYATNS